MKKYLVIGNPIDHSLSPRLHNYWINQNKINAIYEKEELKSNDLENLILRVKSGKISGVNITVPFKQEIIPYLDKLSLEAEQTQSVNTIYLENEKITGHNTDINGFEFAIKDTKYNVANKKVLILGAGGVVPSIIFALYKMKVSSVILSNRTKIKAENLKKIFNNIKIIDWGSSSDSDMIINATSIGLKEEDKFDLDFSKFDKNEFFYDVIYNPKQTNFLKKANKLNKITENGLKMFIYQAAQAFEIWHGIKPKINDELNGLLIND